MDGPSDASRRTGAPPLASPPLASPPLDDRNIKSSKRPKIHHDGEMTKATQGVASDVHRYNIAGVEVQFPFAAYQVQTALMTKCILAMQQREHALLESPTGTGKTLCLLSAVLAWREAYAAKMYLHLLPIASHDGAPTTPHILGLEKALDLAVGKCDVLATATSSMAGSTGESEATGVVLPRILYASRTHSQLSQAMNELKRIPYSAKASVLGSRQQLCLHTDVQNAPSTTARTNMCRAKVANRSCHYHARTQSAKPVFQQHWQQQRGVVDIEELAAFGKRHQACPYYLTREMAPEAVPYNYLIDKQSREAQQLDTKDAVIIFDEAHNLESSCGDATSFELTSNDISHCLQEATLCADVSRRPTYQGPYTTADYGVLYQLLKRFSDGFAALPIRGGMKERIEDGHFIFSVFDMMHVTPETAPKMITLLEAAITVVSGEVALQRRQMATSTGTYRNSGGGTNHTTNNRSALSHLLQMMQMVFPSFPASASAIASASAMAKTNVTATSVTGIALDGRAASLQQQQQQQKREDPASAHFALIQKNFKVHLVSSPAAETKDGGGGIGTGSSSSTRTSSSGGGGRTLSFWCFNPGLAMQDLLQDGCRSLLLASGTLAPLQSVADEFGLPFRHQIENPHVIDASQLLVGVVPRGPRGIPLSSRYETRDAVDYKVDLGETLIDLAKTIPHGMLVFFPSYHVMEQTLRFWQQSTGPAAGLWYRLGKQKHLFSEPKDKAALPALMAAYYAKVDAASNATGSRATTTAKGAIFFAVCRGKVSEGVDFADKKGRAVVITGIPFPAVHDAKVALKKKFLDEAAAAGDSVINGNTWYTQQAARAVNQAIGRVIRHRFDYGAILLCDERFAQPQNRAHLPAWVRPHLQEWSHFDEAQRAVHHFFAQVPTAAPSTTTTTLTTTTSTTATTASRSSASAAAILARSLPASATDGTTTTPIMAAYMAHPRLVQRFGRPFALRKENEPAASLGRDAGVLRKQDVKRPDTVSADDRSLKRARLQSVALEGKADLHTSNPTAKPPSSSSLSSSTSTRRMEMTSGSTSATVAVAGATAAADLTSAAEDGAAYVALVKRSLPTEAYQTFKATVKGFHQKQLSIDHVFGVLQELMSVPGRIHLLRKFAIYCPRQSRQDWVLKCHEIEERVAKEQQAADDRKAAKIEPALCTICRDALRHPFVGRCGHMACMECWLAQLRQLPECRECHMYMKKKWLKRAFFH